MKFFFTKMSFLIEENFEHYIFEEIPSDSESVIDFSSSDEEVANTPSIDFHVQNLNNDEPDNFQKD